MTLLDIAECGQLYIYNTRGRSGQPQHIFRIMLHAYLRSSSPWDESMHALLNFSTTYEVKLLCYFEIYPIGTAIICAMGLQIKSCIYNHCCCTITSSLTSNEHLVRRDLREMLQRYTDARAVLPTPIQLHIFKMFTIYDKHCTPCPS